MKRIKGLMSRVKAIEVLFVVAMLSPSVSMALGFNTMFASLGSQAAGAKLFVTMLAGLAGGVAVLTGLFKMWKASDGRGQVEPKEIIIPLVAGGALLAFTGILAMSSESVTGAAAGAATGF